MFHATPTRDSLSSIGSRGLIRESRRVGVAMNSADSMESILYIPLGGLDFTESISCKRFGGYPLCL